MIRKLLFRVILLCCPVFPLMAEDSGQLNFDNAGVVTVPELTSVVVTVSGKTELHVTNSTPLTSATVDLQSEDSWLYLDAVKPSAVITQYIKTKVITINGDSIVLKLGADSDNARQNARIAVYGQGAVVIPGGNLSDNNALQVFTETGFGGDSKYYPIFTRNTNLGAFNNAIRSFKLKKGYMATLANHTDGTGFSKVFIADTADLEMSAMPKGLEATVSFIRVMRWDWISQKGWAGGDFQVGLTNSTTCYNWNINGDSSTPDWNYVPIKQKLGWPSDADIQNKRNVNHELGYNEPEHSEQHQDDNNGNPITVAQAVNLWPGMLTSGLRLGSPAPTDFSWLYNFITECNKRNYRVDFVAIHAYWYTAMTSWRSQLLAVWNNTNRPVWITEWNNGANWTGNNFPNQTGTQCDADGNPIPGANSVTLPCTTANAAKQKSDITSIVNIMEDPALHIERYFIYEWVQDARAMELSGKLTPAGKWYAENPSRLAYTEAYNHQWKLVVPDFSFTQSAADPTQYTFSWKDYNRETAIGYVLERRYSVGGTWGAISDTIPAIHTDTGYSNDDAVPKLSTSDILTQSSDYRIKAIGYDNSFIYSSTLSVALDPRATSPVVTAATVSSSAIRLTWSAVANAKSYRIYRASYPDSIYSVLRSSYTSTTYDDNFGLTPNTVYWYKIYSLNNRGESADPMVVKAITNKTNGEAGDDITGIEEVATAGFRFYPNPVKAGQQIFVGDGNLTGKFSVEIADMTGKTVLRFSESALIYAPQVKGMYFVKTVFRQKTEVCRLIVN